MAQGEDASPGGVPATAPGRPTELFDPRTRLGRDFADVDWAANPLGPPAQWPASLRNILRLMLGSRFAMWMAWGPELTFFCNDAYRLNTLGSKYPWALGRRANEVWAEIWPDIGPRIESVIATGQATWDEGLLLFLERSGYPEETYHTFSYSPITGDDGVIAGMLCVVSEETARVISERRMRIVRDLSAALAASGTEAEVFVAAGRQLALDGHSLAFALAYLFDGDGADLAMTAGISAGHPLAPARIAYDDPGAPWPLAALAGGRAELYDLPDVLAAQAPPGAWQEPPRQCMLIPFAQAGGQAPLGCLIVGLNRYRRLDADYRGFVHLVAGQLSAALTRARAFEEERRRAEELAELDRAKTQFFTNVSHELRTPLTLLLGPAEDALVDVEEPLGPAQRNRVEVIARNGERLLKLVNTLLDFSRIQSGQAQGRFEPVDLARWTAEVAAMFDSAVRRAGLTYTVDCPPLGEPVYVDPEMWAKIVLNLLSNALKATFEGEISIRLTRHGDQAQLAVHDTGVGIPLAEQDRLFERFRRVTGARLRTHEGSGIGLALVAELAGIHGGSVGVTSRPGAGSTFTVAVPFGSAHLPPDRVASGKGPDTDARALGQGYLAEADRWLGAYPDKEHTSGSPLGTAGDVAIRNGAPVAGAEPAHVLVVDDNADMRDYITGLLTAHYAISAAADGRQALEQARRDPPDLVLTDVMMPELDGFGLLAALRSDPATMQIPVVMLSARSGEEAAVVGLEAGADDYIVKPFSARELLARVRANLEYDRVRRVYAELERNRELLDRAEQLARVGSWQIDLADDSVTVSAEFARLIGRSRADIEAAGIGGGLLDVHPDDRERARAALGALRTEGTPMDLEVRAVRPDDSVLLVRANAVLDRDGDGRPQLIRGSVQDITEQRAAELAVAESRVATEAAAREHAIAEELQRHLLPARTPRTDYLDIAAYYASGVEDTQAGGDWYDVIPLPGDRTAVVIGDVMGRGVRAAAVMGQLRAMVRAYARLDLPVADLLAQLDGEVLAFGNTVIVTCVYAVIDPHAQTLTYGTAGHVPPLLGRPGEPTRRLVAGDPPLGTGRYGGTVETVDWIPGSRLTLYTDGLVERRGGDLDASIDRVAALLDERDLLVEEIPNALVDVLSPGRLTDDVAVMTVAARGPDVRDITMAIVPARTSASEARRAAAAALDQWGVTGDITSDVALVVSELVTNTVRHGTAPIELRMRLDAGRLVIDVSDAATTAPALREMDPGAANGRGLHLVAAVSRSWGTRPRGNGKSVWCVLDIPHTDLTSL